VAEPRLVERARSESGLATTEVAIIFPVIIGVMLIVVQGALWAHAGAVAQAAADHGAEVASLIGSTDVAAELAAEDFASNSDIIGDVDAIANNAAGSEFVQVTVTGNYPTIFGVRTISVTATSIREVAP